jgi:phospholipase C
VKSQCVRGLPRIVPVCLLVIFTSLTPSPLAARDSRSSIKNFQHVFIIMMENTGFDTLIGNPNAPFINAAAANFGMASNYFGVTHPSQPNYIAATSGSTNGVADDNDTTINVANIVDQIEANGKTWKAYMQSYSLCATKFDHACGIQLYERKHNPFISYQDVQSNPARVANIVDFGQLQPTWLAATWPITPGSALTSAMTCTGGEAPTFPTILVIFPRCSP